MICKKLLLISSLFLFASCSPQGESQTVTKPQPIETSEVSSDDAYEVEAWIDNPTPKQGVKVFVSSGLIKNDGHGNGGNLAG